ncbi:MAG: class I tRNA ligase family protein, partial [Dehalococcoidales bacterium]|nr:class I tRNA ligase family protein [Dehalococcoidales bacterium]
EAGRNFANKLWNATRFIIGSAGNGEVSPQSPAETPLEDRWILSRLARTVASVSGLMADFQFGEAQRQIYDFLWGEFCDWYLEIAKIRLRAEGAASPLPVLVSVMETSLRLLHPFMPFLTEELWHNLSGCLPPEKRGRSISVAPYPEPDEAAVNPDSERVMAAVIEITRTIRNVRAEHKVASHQWTTARIYADELLTPLTPYAPVIETLARARPVSLHDRRKERPQGENTLVMVLNDAEVAIPMESILDLKAERKRLETEIARLETDLTRLETRLTDREFLGKAPAAVIDRERDKLAERKDRLEKLREQLTKLGQP